MRRPPSGITLACVVLITSCLGSDSPTGIEPGHVGIAIQPALVPSAADGSALPIHRIRSTAVRVSDGAVIGENVVDVDPTAASWTLALDVRLPTSPVDVNVTVLLLHVSGGVESVQFSGIVGPLTLSAGDRLQPGVAILRGPVANHSTTGVAIVDPPDTLAVGETATLSATAAHTGSVVPTVFWTVLDAEVLSLSGNTLQALEEGTGRVVASAGAHADTATVVVRGTSSTPRVDVRVEKTVDQSQPLAGERIRFTVSATNLGPGTATDVAVFDTLPRSAFGSPSHEVTLGSLVGDSLWRIPTLPAGQTHTWTTDATVLAGVAGGSAVNQALLRAVSPSDSTPANDSARVTVSFPLSAVPVVQITEPDDSAVFDPGDLVTFVATADDPEEGDLTSSIFWRSNLDGDLGTGGSISTSSLRAGVHTISASATDADGGIGADTVRVTIALYTMPSTLNVPFGGTASLPITLAQPAPVGGITLTIVSSDPSVANPTTPTVFIPQGALSANATLAGVVPGTANITVANAQFGSSVVVATVRAELDILAASVSFAVPFSSSFTVQLESQGVAIAAPAGGLPVSLSAVDPGCVAVAPSITIPAGQVSTSTTLAWGTGTATPCQTYVRATAQNIVADSILVSVGSQAGISVTARTLGAGLQESTGFSLGTSAHGGVTVTLTSSDPATLLVSPNASTAGTGSITIPVPSGSGSATFYVQGVEGTTGTASVTVSAPGFVDGSATMTVVQPGIILASLSPTTTTLSPDNPFYAYVGTPSGNSVNAQNVRAGGPPVTVTFAVDDLAVGVLENSSLQDDTLTATIVPGLYYTPTNVAGGGVAFDPIGVGTTTVTARANGFIAQPLATQQVTVSAPVISVSARTVGAGLQEGSGIGLGASNHGGVTVTVTSSDSATLLVSPNVSTPGTGSFTLPVADGVSSASFYVQGVEGTTGSASVTVSAPGFVDGSATMTVVQPGIILASLSSSTTTLSPDNPFYAYVGTPSGNSVNAQNVRAGGPPVTVTFAVDNPGVGVLENSSLQDDTLTATIVPGLYYTPTNVAGGGVAFDPVGVGTTTVTARASGFIAQPLATQQVTVSAPAISVSSTTVGAGLQQGASIGLGASSHGGVTITVTSSDPATLLVSPNASTPGTASITIPMADGVSSASFYVQGVEGATGAASVTVTAAGFLDGSATATVVQPGLILASLVSSLGSADASDHFYAYAGIPSGSTVSVQNVRAGSPGVTVTATSSNVAAAVVVTSTGSGASQTAVIVPGIYYTPSNLATGGFELDPVGAGQTTVTVTAPGFLTQPLGTQIVTITP